MNGFNVMFTKSTDHGATWSTPVKTYGKVSWNDKPILAVSDNGNDVYISWNGPSERRSLRRPVPRRRAPTWSQTKVVERHPVFLRVRWGRVAERDGRVQVRRASTMAGRGGSLGPGSPEDHVLRSTNSGSSWTANVVDTVELLGRTASRPELRRTTTSGIARSRPTRTARLTLLYEGASTPSKGNETVLRAALDRRRRHVVLEGPAISAAGEWDAVPGRGGARRGVTCARWNMQTSRGGNQDAWNVWYRASTDGGAHVVIACEDFLRDERARRTRPRTASSSRTGITVRAPNHEHRKVHRDLGRGAAPTSGPVGCG